VGLADNGFFTVAPYRELCSWRGRKRMYSVEIGCNAEDLATVMSEMREWLDAQRFEPDIFRHNVARESIYNSRAIQPRKQGHRFCANLLRPAREIVSTATSQP
jgi:hypothetical protein